VNVCYDALAQPFFTLRIGCVSSSSQLVDQMMRSMARLPGYSPSTVSREIKRNGGHDRYRAAVADENAWRRARRPKPCKLANNRWLRQAVARKLKSDWSPEQIAGWLKTAQLTVGARRVVLLNSFKHECVDHGPMVE
jgi:IS30 family transposase